MRNLLYIVTLRALARQAGVQSIAAEGEAAVIRTREGESLPRAGLEDTVPKGVQVGHSLVRVELGDGWRERLRRTLEQLAAARGTQTPART